MVNLRRGLQRCAAFASVLWVLVVIWAIVDQRLTLNDFCAFDAVIQPDPDCARFFWQSGSGTIDVNIPRALIWTVFPPVALWAAGYAVAWVVAGFNKSQ